VKVCQLPWKPHARGRNYISLMQFSTDKQAV